jgi:hypothetical protein
MLSDAAVVFSVLLMRIEEEWPNIVAGFSRPLESRKQQFSSFKSEHFVPMNAKNCTELELKYKTVDKWNLVNLNGYVI